MLEVLAFLFGVAQSSSTLPDLELISTAPVPQFVADHPAPVVSATAVLVYDLGSGKVLYEKNAHARLPVASLTKLMTAVIVRENFALDDIVTVSAEASAQPPAKVWLRRGEQITVKNLLPALLIKSGNDAAIALAEHFQGGISAFIRQMNIKAGLLGLKNTHFANPVGYDDEHGYSSAYDLAILSGYLLNDVFLREIVGTQRRVVADTIRSVAHALVSTNILFNSYLDIHGLKTGSTEEAGECLAVISRTTAGRDILAIVLDSSNRFQEGKLLLEWASTNFKW